MHESEGEDDEGVKGSGVDSKGLDGVDDEEEVRRPGNPCCEKGAGVVVE